jgi:hypothetical protein
VPPALSLNPNTKQKETIMERMITAGTALAQRNPQRRRLLDINPVLRTCPPPVSPLTPNRKTIPVHRGGKDSGHAVVSEQDYDLVKAHMWRFLGGRVVRHDGQKWVALSHQILGLLDSPKKSSYRIRHVNGDPFDCTRENLQVKPPTSNYLGVRTDETGHRATITLDEKHIDLGSYPCEPEAAFAFNYACQLTKKIESGPNTIPDEHLPSPERQQIIKQEVDVRLSRKFKRRQLHVKGYRGVHRFQKRWKAQLHLAGEVMPLGSFLSDHLAAFAYNHAEKLLRNDAALLNTIPADLLPSDPTQALLKKLFEVRLKLQGHFDDPDLPNDPAILRYRAHQIDMLLSGRYAGVKRHKPSGSWHGVIVSGGKPLHLGYYRDEHQAALAVNIAETQLNPTFSILNPIAPENLPDNPTKEKIRSKVEARLRATNLVI